MLIVDVCFWMFEGSSSNPDSYGEVIHLPKPDMFVAAPMRRTVEGIGPTTFGLKVRFRATRQHTRYNKSQ